MIGLIAGLARPLIGGVVDYVSTGQEIRKAEKENKARLMRDKASNNHEWEMASLADKDRWLRRISFAMFSAPFIWALFDPVGVETYFTIALSSVPEWWLELYAAMIGGVWGISALKNSMPALVGGVVKAVRK
ncbi:Protein of unknown function (DUF3154) [uncultured Mediterranean phage uvMED]|nr:Protein of unknown function (DUF3154) [uncultured Mediterranean phage uvMED]